MVKITEKDGVITLDGEEFSLKIDKSRKIYIKKINENNFSYIDHDTEIGMSSDDKKRYLYGLYRLIDSKSRQE